MFVAARIPNEYTTADSSEEKEDDHLDRAMKQYRQSELIIIMGGGVDFVTKVGKL